MEITFTETHTPSDQSLVGAVALRCSRVFPALNLVNALGGQQTMEWKIVRTYSLMGILAECDKRKLDLSKTMAKVEGGPVMETPAYLYARKKMAETATEALSCP